MTSSPRDNSFVAGCAGGLASCTIGHPFDTVKLIQQTATGAGQNSLRASSLKVLSTGGLRSFWSGIGPALAVQALTCGFLFGMQSRISASVSMSCLSEVEILLPSEYRLQQSMAISSVSCASVSGFLTGGLLSPLICPLEAIKCRSQVSLPWHSGSTSLYSGFSATVMRCSVGNAAFFGMYAFTSRSDNIGAGLGGALAGAAFWVAAMPFDVIKSRMQTAQEPFGFVATLRRAVTTEGLHALYTGLPITLMRAVPMNATCLFTYEAVLKLSNQI